MALVAYPEFLQTRTYGADRLRYLNDRLPLLGEGCEGLDMLVSQRGAGANMSVDVAAGDAWIRGDSTTRQGLYHLVNDAVANTAVGAADPANPRLDQIIARINDTTILGGSDVPTLEVVAGTATVGASLDNRVGAAALPASAILLADVLVGAAVASITNANIRDRRAIRAGSVPPLLTDVDMVPLVPLIGGGASGDSSPAVNNQGAFAVILPRRIVGATRMRWATTGSVASSTVCFGLYDASGRKIVDTGAVSAAVSGRVSSVITATTLEAGIYYAFVGTGATRNDKLVGYSAGTSEPNTFLFLASGGTTAPQTILGFGDVPASGAWAVPRLTLSVG